MIMLEKAIAIAVQVHAGQEDKAGKPYILHPIRVMMKMETGDEMITAVLHDVIEDSEDHADRWTIERLREEGFSEEILHALDNLTRRDGEPYGAFIDRVKTSPLSRRVKLADLEDNMDVNRIPMLDEHDVERLEKYHRAWMELQ